MYALQASLSRACIESLRSNRFAVAAPSGLQNTNSPLASYNVSIPAMTRMTDMLGMVTPHPHFTLAWSNTNTSVIHNARNSSQNTGIATVLDGNAAFVLLSFVFIPATKAWRAGDQLMPMFLRDAALLLRTRSVWAVVSRIKDAHRMEVFVVDRCVCKALVCHASEVRLHAGMRDTTAETKGSTWSWIKHRNAVPASSKVAVADCRGGGDGVGEAAAAGGGRHGVCKAPGREGRGVRVDAEAGLNKVCGGERIVAVAKGRAGVRKAADAEGRNNVGGLMGG
jgi:hypothetical protein